MSRRLLACLVLLTPAVAVATPAVVPIQGTLTDIAGVPVNGVKNLTFSIYADATGGTPIHTETQTLLLDSGVFTAYLGGGGVQPLDLAIFDGGDLWLGIAVGTDAEMSPRLRFGTVPYAAYAERGPMATPSGAVMFFDLPTCPDGWTAYDVARGRAVVGLPAGGTLAGTYPAVGGALTNQQAIMINQVPAHTHHVAVLGSGTGGSHTHGVTGTVTVDTATHTHSVSGSVTVNSTGSTHTHDGTSDDGIHTHAIRINASGGGSLVSLGASYYTNTASYNGVSATISSGGHSHWVQSPGSSHSHGATFSSGVAGSHTHGHSAVFGSGVAATSAGATHTHSVPAHDTDSSGVAGVDVTLPYIQLLACRKD